MRCFSTFKDKRYWILLIPSIIFLVLFAIFASDYILDRPYITLTLIIIFIALFWSTYHMWRYVGDRKKNNTDDSGDL